jgi:dipeptidyl aminopeptidase/acylaminoacyl peptidase
MVTNMARVGGCWSPTFSPDGMQISLVSNFTGAPRLYVMDSTGSFPQMISPLRDPTGSVQWSPDGAWLAFSVTEEDGANNQMFLIHPDGGGLRRISDPKSKSNFINLWSPDSREVYFTASLEQPESLDVYAYNLASGKTRLILDKPGINYFEDLSHDGNWGIVYNQEQRGDENLYLLEIATGHQTLLTPHAPPGTFEPAHFSPDGRTIYLSTNDRRDRLALGRIRLEAPGKPGPIEVIAGRDNSELQEFAIDPKGKFAVVVWNASGLSQIEFLDLATLELKPGFTPLAEIVGNLRFSPDGDRLAMLSFGSLAPPDIAAYRFSTAELRLVTRSPHAGVDLSTIVRPELINYRASDDLPLSGWLYRPAGTKGPLPTVIIVHGGPEEQERPTFLGTYQGLVRQGIAVFAPNVRGSSGFGKRFVNLDNGALRANSIRDVGDTVKFLAREGISDPARIGIFGFSYGGYLTMSALAEFPDLFRAGVDLYGIVNFETFFANTEPWLAALAKVEYGDPVTQKDMLRDLSPIHKVGKIRAPVLVIHGANDTNVPISEAEQVVARLREKGVEVEYIVVPNEGHGFVQEESRIRTSVSVVRWFETHLKDAQPQAAASLEPPPSGTGGVQ